MSIIVKSYTFSAGATIIASEHNSNFDTIYADYNGHISNANIDPAAAIEDYKLEQITTASKVSGSALTTLGSIPSGAGIIPSANVPVGTTAITGGTGSAGAGKQYVEIIINGNTYKVLHDGTV